MATRAPCRDSIFRAGPLSRVKLDQRSREASAVLALLRCGWPAQPLSLGGGARLSLFIASTLIQHANRSHSVQGLLAMSIPVASDPQPAARDEPAGCWSALGGPIGILRISHLLPDQHPVTPPARVFVVAVLQLVTRGCRDTSRSIGIDALGDAGPTASAGELRPLRHCGREAYDGQQGETRAGEQ